MIILHNNLILKGMNRTYDSLPSNYKLSDASLIMLLSNAEAFIRTNSKNPWTIRGMRREEKSDYPFNAVREVLVNALIHRDYQNIGSEIHVDMYDDKMEISSPGGMINGSRIQELDLKKIPSMRRNEIISDIFGRLHYMDRRGSGIRRILNSYSDYIEKPEFYSDEYFFIVTLPNRNEASYINELDDLYVKADTINETDTSDYKVQLSHEKTQLSHEKTQLSSKDDITNDMEALFIDKLKTSFNKSSSEKLIILFKKYNFSYYFNRKILANSLNITENGASRIIRKAIDCGIMRKEKKGEYYFNNDFDNADQ